MSWVSWLVVSLAGLTSTIAAVAITAIIILVISLAFKLGYRGLIGSWSAPEQQAVDLRG